MSSLTSHHNKTLAWFSAALLTALALGVWLRWFLAGQAAIPLDFKHLRHAHSHVGFFGVLFPLAWLGWAQARARGPGLKTGLTYAGAVVLSTIGFLQAGYGPVAIVGSTIVGAIWIITAWRLRRRMLSLYDPLGAILPGVILAEACIPPIAYFLRRQPDLAHGFVTMFLSALLLLVIIPSALAARKTSAGPWPVYLLCAGLGTCALGVWPHPISFGGLGVGAMMIAIATLRAKSLEPWLRALWLAVSVGLTALSLGLVPNNRAVGVGSIHFMILGPVLATLAPSAMKLELPAWSWWIYAAATAAFGLALVAMGLTSSATLLSVAAWTGTAVALWWTGALVAQVIGAKRTTTTSPS